MALVALTAAAPSLAADREDRQIAGAWGFVTEPFDRSCVIRGRMQLTPGPKPGALSCRFEALQTCADGQWKTVQSCTATRTGKALEISSTLISVAPQANYRPDDFTLSIESPRRMAGEFHSHNRAKVTFTRMAEAIS
jgi:hypothetical protein